MPGFERFGNDERKEVNDVLKTGVLMRYGFEGMREGHFKAKELEELIQSIFKVKHAHVLSSGTAAVTTALAVAGVGHGDEVIMPSFTFVATFEAIISVGAIPIVVDIDDTLTLDPKAVEAAITDKTKAIMPVHMCGSMAQLDKLASLCLKHNLVLIEDACQAIGGTYQGKALGTIGDLGCFSFDYVKTVTCGEGGAVITDNDKFAKLANQFTDHGHDHKGQDRGAEKHPHLGFNFRLSELNAAVGVAQFKKLSEFLDVQKTNYQIIKESLQSIPQLEFRRVPEGGVENYGFLNFFLPNYKTAAKVAAHFKECGIDGCFHYYDNNWHYVRKWRHLKSAKSLFPLNPQTVESLEKLGNKSFKQSDHYIGRNISCLIKLGWSKKEVKNR
ncbi:MAG: DegT/DnrJ/EryC1/StrS family aminotransferase, partial [Flavobacteriaceae bacterium]|nr:DegT/DnrJ/EryC1/StrS family aminotransferase [Flavobacteriaceae bacterium]